MGHLAQQHGRHANATAALLAAKRELLAIMRPTDRAIPGLYTGRVLAADDQFGREAGLIAQGDGIAWAQMDALFYLAEVATAMHLEDDGHRGYRPGCDVCQKIIATTRNVNIVDSIRARTASPSR